MCLTLSFSQNPFSQNTHYPHKEYWGKYWCPMDYSGSGALKPWAAKKIDPLNFTQVLKHPNYLKIYVLDKAFV